MKARAIVIATGYAILIAVSGQAAEDVRQITGAITKVSVYTNGATVTRTARLTLEPGEFSLQVDGLPQDARPASFRVSVVDGRAMLLGFKLKASKLTEPLRANVRELQELEADIQQNRKGPIEDRLGALNHQRNMLVKLAENAGKQMSGDVENIEDWGRAYAFVGERLTSVNDSIRRLNQEAVELEKLLDSIRAEVTSLTSDLVPASRTAWIDLQVISGGPVVLEISYVVASASWEALYDARLSEDGSQVELRYYGVVAQETGEDWNDVELTLSTASPTSGIGPESLLSWHLRAYDPNEGTSFTVDTLLTQVSKVTTSSYGQVFIRGGRSGEVSYIADGVPFDDPLGGLGQAGSQLSRIKGSVIDVSVYATDFSIPRKETIPSGSRTTHTTIAEFSFDAELGLVARPRSQTSVFRIATIRNTSEAPLIPGQMASFAGSHYLGHLTLKRFVAENDTLTLPFGIDHSVTGERKMVENRTSHRWDRVRLEQTIKITLTNHSAERRTVRVEEPFPVSSDERVEVELRDIEPKRDNHDESKEAGIWTVEIGPGASETIEFSYVISHPEDVNVLGL